MLPDGCVNSIIIRCTLFHRVALFVQRNLVKRLFHPQTCRSVRSMNKKRGRERGWLTVGNRAERDRGWQKQRNRKKKEKEKKNKKHIRSFETPVSPRIRQSVSQTLTSANICIRKSRPNICLRASSNIRPSENFSHLLRLFLSPVCNNSRNADMFKSKLLFYLHLIFLYFLISAFILAKRFC